MVNKSVNKLSQHNILSLYKFLFFYTKEYSNWYGLLNWDDISISKFCKENRIVHKGRRNQYYNDNFFWFKTFTPKDNNVNDTAYHFLRHVRNAIAHANIRKESRKKKSYFVMDDFDKNGKQTMHGEIEENLFFHFIELIVNTKNK